jgi:hypothetical protein
MVLILFGKRKKATENSQFDAIWFFYLYKKFPREDPLVALVIEKVAKN